MVTLPVTAGIDRWDAGWRKLLRHRSAHGCLRRGVEFSNIWLSWMGKDLVNPYVFGGLLSVWVLLLAENLVQ